MNCIFLRSRFSRSIAWALVFAQVLISIPADAFASASSQVKKPEDKIAVNRKAPVVTPLTPFPRFSPSPTDQELFAAHVFEEPLVPMGTAASSTEENQALASALLQYLKTGNTENLTPVESFLETHSGSRWRASLLTDMGLVYRRTGYFTKALEAWEEAWNLAKNESAPMPRAIADRAVAEWAELNARVGRMDVLEPLFKELENRDIGGSPAEKLRGAKQGLWLMQNKPGDAFRCGPFALDRILAFQNRDYKQPDLIPLSQSTVHGMSLTEVWKLSEKLHMKWQMALRTGDAPVLLPAVVHWRAGHYAALLREENGRYLVQDPTFGDEFWVSRAALNQESSGFFLVPAPVVSEGWQVINESQGNSVWGKGNTGTQDPHSMKRSDQQCDSCSKNNPGNSPGPGMAVYNFHLMLVNLTISDLPVGYAPPRGPSVEFQVTYNQKESFQPSIFTYSNLGPKWTLDWLSYIKDDPSNPNATAYLYARGGGEEVYTGFNSSTQSYSPQMESRAMLIRTSVSPIQYERRLPDGAVEVFAQADGAATFPRRVFMTQWKDPAGNAVTYTYDASLRLVSATDAIGQVTTLSYDLASDPLKITRVTDPFGRFATFDYTATGRLQRITDVVGLQSSFGYGPSDFISAMTTPYGTTTFAYGEPDGTTRWLEATDPLGGTERVEYRHSAPGIADSESAAPQGMTVQNGFLEYRNSFYWDKRALSLYRGDYTKAVQYHFLHLDANTTSGILESTKRPLENRVWYQYAGQSSPFYVGASKQPIAVGRVLDDGTTQLYRYEYNAVGRTTKTTDPLGRETVFVYGTNNVADPDPANGTSVDLQEVRQRNGAVYDILESRTYNSQHLPLTVTDAARQTTTFTYRTTGDPETIITPPRSTLTQTQRTTTLTYYPDNAPLGAGRLQRISGPVAGATTDFAYDGKGRPRTVTESDGYALTTDYDDLDRPTRVTYPDNTYEETTYTRLDSTDQRDRLGRWTHFFYDPVRRLVLTSDPMGRTIRQQWCICGVLDKLIDANGNATIWDRDAAGRINKETRADNSQTLFTYENTTSRLKRRTDPKVQYRDTAYFKDNTIQQISYPNSSPATPSVSFTYDSVYKRIATTVDGTGTTAYTYYPVTTGGTLGATQLATVDGPLSNDTISYSYDELGRLLSRSINSVAASQTYDVLGRTDSVSNVLGTFNYTYVDQTPRVQSVSYPNGQTTTYSYFANSGDRRLQEILNQKTGGITISKFDYTYDVVGNISSWTQQADSDPAKAYNLLYDRADQLMNATWRTTDAVPSILKHYAYAYDSAGNRTTEQIDDVPLKASYNNMNRIVSQDPGGITRFAGTLSEAAKVTIQSKAASVAVDGKFSGTALLTSGTNTIQVQATDYNGNTRTNTYQVDVSGASNSFSFDPNGNETSDATRTFEWDAENRLTAINNGTHRSEFSYDGLSRRVRIVEKDNNVVTTDTRFLWCDEELCEERDSAGGTTTKRFFSQGEQQGTDIFLYTRDHLGSIRELVDALTSATIRARYEYDSYGRTTKLPGGDKDASFAFTGNYAHVASGLLLTHYRGYDPNLGQWISEDPLGLGSDLNFYQYAQSNPIRHTDPRGLQATAPLPFPTPLPVPFIPPVAIPGSKENKEFTKDVMDAGAAVGQALEMAADWMNKVKYPPGVPPPVDLTKTKECIEQPLPPFTPKKPESDPCVLLALCMAKHGYIKGIAKCAALVVPCASKVIANWPH